MSRALRGAPIAGGILAGLCLSLNWLSSGGRYEQYSRFAIALRLAAAVCLCSLAALGLRTLLLYAARRSGAAEERGRLSRIHALSYLVWLPLGAGAFGFRFESAAGCVLLIALTAAFLGVNAFGAAAGWAESRGLPFFRSRSYLAALFFLSGIAALIYQIAWERALFNCFGVNIESVTIVVTIFMLGLGLGALAGGRLSRQSSRRLPLLFLAMESGIGIFGMLSLPLIHLAGIRLASASPPIVVVAVSLLLLPPTLMMGATLPILVEYLFQTYRNMGRTVGLLYFANTLGSACACFIAADLLFVYGGRQAAVVFAAICNFTVGVLVYDYARRAAHVEAEAPGLTEEAA